MICRFWKWFLLLIAINLFVWVLKWHYTGAQHAQLCRIQQLLSLQIVLVAFSIIIYRRISNATLELLQLRKLILISTILFLASAHGAWLSFYIYLPENSYLVLFSFLCVSVFVHMSAFIVTFFVLEKFSNYCLPNVDQPILKSKHWHTCLALILAILLTFAGVLVTQTRPKVRYENVLIPGLAPELDGFKIALITDVHIGPTVGRERVGTIVSITNSLQPDVITIVGDLVDGFVYNLQERAIPLKNLSAKYGKYFSTGNHEYYHDDVDKWVNFFRTTLNLTVLRNENNIVRTEKLPLSKTNDGYGTICFVGVDDLITNRLHIPGHKMDAEKAIKGCLKQSTIVLLAHQPNAAREIIDQTKQRHIHLILSGHTHGGQFYILWLFAYWQNAFLHGLYRDYASGTQVFVSSGVNYWGPPVKMNELCEIVLLKLHSGTEDIMNEFEASINQN